MKKRGKMEGKEKKGVRGRNNGGDDDNDDGDINSFCSLCPVIERVSILICKMIKVTILPFIEFL